MPLSTQVYRGGVEILPVASCYRNWDKCRPDWPLGSYADFTLLHVLLLKVVATM